MCRHGAGGKILSPWRGLRPQADLLGWAGRQKEEEEEGRSLTLPSREGTFFKQTILHISHGLRHSGAAPCRHSIPCHLAGISLAAAFCRIPALWLYTFISVGNGRALAIS